MNSSTPQRISGFLLLLGSAFLLAVGVVSYFVMNHGPSGQYLAKNAMLSPPTLSILNYKDTNIQTGALSRFVFEGVEFIWQDNKIYLDEEKYAKIYDLLSRDKSLLSPSNEIVELFSQSPIAHLVLLVKSENNLNKVKVTKSFQEIQFVPQGDHFRVELPIQKAEESWAYYYHPGIFHKILEIVVPKA